MMTWVDTVVGSAIPVIAAAMMAVPVAIWRLIRRLDHLTDRVIVLERELIGLREDYRRQGPYGRYRKTRVDDP